MKLLTALAFFTTISTAAGYLCYVCSPMETSCTKAQHCVGMSDPRCYKSKMLGWGCMESDQCLMNGVNYCCEGELCNGHSRPRYEVMSSASLALPTVLLLSLTATITLYLNQDLD